MGTWESIRMGESGNLPESDWIQVPRFQGRFLVGYRREERILVLFGFSVEAISQKAVSNSVAIRQFVNSLSR